MNLRLLETALIAMIACLPSAIGLGQVPAIQYRGSGGCVSCHDGVTNPGFDHEFCLIDESIILQNNDWHMKAFDALKGEKAQQMQQLLPGLKDATKDERCLSCHAGREPASPAFDPTAFELTQGSGVSCETCHGPSSAYFEPHSAGNLNWRTKSPDEKARMGMIDVHDPIVRARLCISCHVGDFSKGRVITHEMYAAGHPPLPSFEVSAFMRMMPPHWRNIRDKGDFRFKDEYLAVNRLGDPDKVLAEAQASIVGGAVLLHDSVKLFRELTQAGDASPWQSFPRPARPEFAAYDCASCHHDLQSDSWRQRRGYEGRRPGRPSFPAWQAQLAELAVRFSAGEDADLQDRLAAEYQTRWIAFQRAVEEQPFAMSQDVTHAADDLSDLLRGVETRLKEATFEGAQVKVVHDMLPPRIRNSYDFHSARQLLWMYATLRGEATYYRDRSPDIDLGHQAWLAMERQAKAEHFENLMQTTPFDHWSDVLKLRGPSGPDPLSPSQWMDQWLSAMRNFEPEQLTPRLNR